MAVDFVRVVYNESSTNVDLDGKIRTFSDIARVAANDHLGRITSENVPMRCLCLRGPVVATSKVQALIDLKLLGDLELSDSIDASRSRNGA